MLYLRTILTYYADEEADEPIAVLKKAVDKRPVKGKETLATTMRATGLDTKLEKQSKDLWIIKDNLREHVSTAEMRDMLTANDQDATGSEYDLRERWLVF